MKGSSYRERDYAFGQVLLTLRTRFGLTQTALADLLGVTRRAVIDWEGGLAYPKVDHLKQFVVLAIERQVWPFGREAEEVRTFWQAARQKVPLDEAWLGGLLSHLQAPRHPSPERRRVSLPTRSLPPLRAGHASIGATRQMGRASMGARGNWTYSLRGWSRSAVGCSACWARVALASRPW